jgi:hypothetical protein
MGRKKRVTTTLRWRRTVTTNDQPDPLKRELGLYANLLHGHLLWHPQPHAATNKAKPCHEVALLGALEMGKLLSDETGVDEKARETRCRMVLDGKMVSVGSGPSARREASR